MKRKKPLSKRTLSLLGISCFSLVLQSSPIQAENRIIEVYEKTVSQQKQKITGVITDEAGEPLIGVNVTVKGSTVGTVSNENGQFTLPSVEKNGTLVFSYIGYTTQEVPIKSQSNIKVILKEDTEELNEVVVTALGMKKEKKALGYSVSSVKSDDITNAGTPMNAMSALYGKTSGLQLATTASGPSGGMNIKVRNAVSLTESSNTRPLIVVDGIPIFDENTGQSRNSVSGGDRGTGINDINPEDIESIEILKGAKAAVLYGSEGANGVLLITTKSGRKKGLGIDFSTNYSWNKAAYAPELQNEFGSGSSPGSAALSNISPDGFYMMKDPVTGEMKEALWYGGGSNFGPKMDGRDLLWWDNTYRPYSAQKNNMYDMFRTGGQANVNLALSNSGDLGSFRVSYNFRDFKHISVGADNQSHTFSFNGDLKANKYITLKVNTNYTYTKDHNAPYSIQDIATYGLPREMSPTLIRDMMVTQDGYNYFSNEAMKNRFPASAYISEYYWSQLENDNRYTRNHLIQSLGMDVKFSDKVTWNTLGGMDYTHVEQEVKNKVGRPLAEESKQGYYGLMNRRLTTFYAQSSINYNETFGRWGLSLMGGGAIKRNEMEQQNIYIKEEFSIENWFSMNNTRNPNGPRADRARGKDLLLSVYASAQLSFDNAIYAEVQARNDWSSILPPQNNSYFYPGVSLSWIATESLKLPDFIKFGKLRASWADVGRPGPRYYGNVDFALSSYGGFPILGMGDYLPPADFAGSNGGFPKPNLKPERKREYEFGLEASFLELNRISVDFSFFTNNTYNQIVTLPVPSSSGVKEVRMNAGDIGQKGIELSINTKPIITKNFTWNLGVNLANYTTKINKLAKGITEQNLWGATGARIVAPEKGQYGEIWVNPYKVNETGERVVGGNGVWEVDNTKWKKVGKITPDVIGGLTNSFTYKGFTLNAVIDFQFGATMISQTNMYLLGNGSGKESLKYRDEARGGLPYYMNNDGTRVLLDKHSAAVPTDSKYPFVLHDGVIVPGVKSDGTTNDQLITAEQFYGRLYWQGGMSLLEDQVYKSDYISMRQLSLSYDLPKNIVSKLRMNSARVMVFGNNLFYIYKAIPNVTPESAQSTNSYTEISNIPGVRSFGIGLNVSF
ncbi:MAG: SusC/RagA family TonB-linked outer membrane protein [Tannerellaceae bacterium]